MIPPSERHAGFQECPCGSNQVSQRLFDARGIYCCRICPSCEKQARARYRLDVLTNPNYDCNEPIEPEE